MSDQSDTINTIFRDNAERALKEGVFTSHQEVIQSMVSAHCESAHDAYHFFGHLVRGAGKKHFRHWAGHAAWESPEEAIQATKETANTFILPTFHIAFADGLQLGHGVGHLIKKFRWFHEEGKLYENEAFRQESSLLLWSLLSDYDTKELFEREFAAATHSISEGSGFNHMEAEEANEKIFDLWTMVGMGGFSQMFASGQAYGYGMREEPTKTSVEGTD